MRHKTIKVFAYFVLSFGLMGCPGYDVPEFPVGEVEGYKPVYATAANTSILWQEPRGLQQPGKIYVYGHYLLVNEKYKGIHFFDNADPAHPEPLGFLRIYGNIDMAIKNDVLYVDHLGSLVALNISNPAAIEELSRIKTWTNDFPPYEGRYFECADPSKGEVIGWELARLKKPECFK